MIDLHCHYLPGIDDGAPTLEASLMLANAAVADGISTAVMTPHVHPGRYANDLASIAGHVTRFREALAANGIPLQIRAGGEVHLTAEIVEMVEMDELPCIGELDGYRIALIELPPSHIPVGALRLAQWLLGRRIRPMIAHPERNRETMRDPERIYPFVAMGCLLQLTAASVTGRFGKPAQESALHMLDRQWASVLASDAHSIEYRPPEMGSARAILAGRYGMALAERLTVTMPASIVDAKSAGAAGANDAR